jgi:hypothetical protein
MALYGSSIDISTFRHLAKEVISNIVATEVVFYVIALAESQTNHYGEASKKFYYPGVLLNSLVIREAQTTLDEAYGPDGEQLIIFKFLRDDLIQVGIDPNNGDIIMYRNDYYEIDNTNENQYLFEKNPDFSYSQATELQGESWSVSCETHQTRAVKLDITRQTL